MKLRNPNWFRCSEEAAAVARAQTASRRDLEDIVAALRFETASKAPRPLILAALRSAVDRLSVPQLSK